MGLTIKKMIYVSLSTIPERLKNLNKSVESLLNQTLKPNKIFINIPLKYRRFSETIEKGQIPEFNSDFVKITRCEDCGPGTKLLGSLILADDDHIYKDYMIEKFFYFYNKNPNNAYSFYVYPLENSPVGQGADGFAINTNHLVGIENFYKKIVKDYKELFLNDDVWISYFLYFIKKIKIFSLREHLKKDNQGKFSLIYTKDKKNKGLIETYGEELEKAVKKRDKISIESFKYMKEKTKGLSF